MQLFAHHTVEHTVTSNIYYYGAALIMISLLMYLIVRREK